MRGPRPDRSGSSSFRHGWFNQRWFRPGWIALIVFWLVLALVGSVLLIRWRDYRATTREDLGPGPIRGVRLVSPAPDDLTHSCPGVGADLPLVRLVEQVPVDVVVMCLGPNKLPASLGSRLSAYEVKRGASAQADAALTRFASAFSLGDQTLPWWSDRANVACPANVAPVYPLSITVGSQTLRVVTPTGACQGLDPALQAGAALAEVATPV